MIGRLVVLVRRRPEVLPVIVLAVVLAIAPSRTARADDGELYRCQATLDQTELALVDATDRLEDARPILRRQIQQWRAAGRSWAWIKSKPAWAAYRGPLLGT